MAERQVTIDGESRVLSNTFLVLATQNPIESLGAYPLPEAQLDRFAMKLRIGYPSRKHELDLLARSSRSLAEVVAEQVLEPGQLERLQASVTEIAVTLPVQEYLVSHCGSHSRKHIVYVGSQPERTHSVAARCSSPRHAGRQRLLSHLTTFSMLLCP